MDLQIYDASRIEHNGTSYLLARECGTQTRYLGVRGEIHGFSDLIYEDNGLCFFSINQTNTTLISRRLPWLKPQPLGIQAAIGFGDRLGIATPGHVTAAKETKILPIFAQQSVRENARTRRSPHQVMNDAIWGLFQEGWQGRWGADADHIKNIDELDSFAQAGYSFFTLDLSEQLTDIRFTPNSSLKELTKLLPWDKLLSTPEALFKRYVDRQIDLSGVVIEFDQYDFLRAITKYGRAIAHVVLLYQHLSELITEDAFDLEISLDETDDPMSVQEHYMIVSELARLGVKWQSLAPRYCGEFCKGIDYIGDLDEFDADLQRHVAVMREFGTYKLSLHSGSDKFRIFPSFSTYTGGQFHIKTAGTSYLEALRIVAQYDSPLFAEILDLARTCFSQDRISYHLNVKLERVPHSRSIQKRDLPALLDDDHARQVLHVTFGSVLERFGGRLKEVLSNREQEYRTGLKEHFIKHLSLLSH